VTHDTAHFLRPWSQRPNTVAAFPFPGGAAGLGLSQLSCSMEVDLVEAASQPLLPVIGQLGALLSAQAVAAAAQRRAPDAAGAGTALQQVQEIQAGSAPG